MSYAERKHRRSTHILCPTPHSPHPMLAPRPSPLVCQARTDVKLHPSSDIIGSSHQGVRTLAELPFCRSLQPCVMASWQVQFPKNWWGIPLESSLGIEQQYQSNSATATYRYCKSKKHNEWSEYTIDFATMTQQNVHSEGIRNCFPKRGAAMEQMPPPR